MLIRKVFKFKLKTNYKTNQELTKISGHCRFLWNKCLSLNKERLNNKQRILYYNELSFWNTIWKSSDEYSFLKECPSQVLQQKIKDLDKAFKDAFDKQQPNKRLPRFKKKGLNNNFRFPQGFKVQGNQVYLPKIGWLGFHKSRDIVGKTKNITISKYANDWYVSIQTEQEITEATHSSKTIVGIDLGVVKLATLSDGTYYQPKNSFKKLANKLRTEQRALSRKKKFSNNWKKQKPKITKIHKTIANARKDYLHWITTRISKNHAMIVLEDLKVKNMTKSAKGTIDNPGKNVKAKSGLNKSILDQGWGEFKRQLEYKQKWRGGDVILVNPKYTSQACSVCNNVCADNRTSQSEFKCVACGHKTNADFNAALNVLRAGHVQLACGDIERVTA